MTTTLHPTDEAPALAGAEPEPLSVAEARALGFDAEGIQILRERGLLQEDAQGQPWRPQTLADVNWIIRELRLLAAEEEGVQTQYERRMRAILAARKRLDAYAGECREITREHLPVNPKTGAFKRRYVDLDDGRAKVRTVRGGPRLIDPQALLARLREAESGPVALTLLDALKVTVTYERFEALALVDREGAKVQLLATPIKELVAALPPAVDPDTGEARPAALPGVEWVPDREEWSWE